MGSSILSLVVAELWPLKRCMWSSPLESLGGGQRRQLVMASMIFLSVLVVDPLDVNDEVSLTLGCERRGVLELGLNGRIHGRRTSASSARGRRGG